MFSRFKRVLASPASIVVAAFAIRMGFLVHAELSQPTFVNAFQPIGFETGSIARSIAMGHGFSSPLGIETGPTAWLTPAYPYLLAALFKIFGVYTAASNLVILTLNCVFASFTCLPLYLLGRRTFEPWVGVATAWLWAVMPRSIYYSTTWVWDTSLCALLMAALLLATVRMADKTDKTSTWIGYGALWALVLLTNPSFLVLAPCFCIWLGVYRHKRGQPWLRPLTFAILALTVGVSPWLIRNYVVLGKFVPFRSNFGLELYLGNNKDVVNAWSWWLHPNDNADERKLYQEVGEIKYMALKQQEALGFIRTHPGEFLWLNWQRFTQTWAEGDSIVETLRYSNLQGRVRTLLFCALSFLGFAGLLFAHRRKLPEMLPLGSVLLVFPGVYYITHTNSRYRHPLDPILCLLAVYAAREIYLQLRSRFSTPRIANGDVSTKQPSGEHLPEEVGAFRA